MYTTTATTPVHRASDVLVGVVEQFDPITDGAIPVLVDDVMDALAVESISRISANRWADVPRCGSTLAKAQATILGRHSAANTVIRVPNEGGEERWATAGRLDSRPTTSDACAWLSCTPGRMPSTLFQSADDHETL